MQTVFFWQALKTESKVTYSYTPAGDVDSSGSGGEGGKSSLSGRSTTSGGASTADGVAVFSNRIPPEKEAGLVTNSILFC